MAWVVGKKSDSSLVELTNNDRWTLEKLKAIIPFNKGGVASDYSFFEIDQVQFDKISSGWAYVLTWASGEITGIDFTGETSKPWVKLSSTKAYIANDGIESTVITLEVWKPDLSSIAATVQRTAFRVTIITPDGERFVRINIVNGIGTATLKTTKAGAYIFPAEPKRFGTMRIFNQLRIDVDDLTLLS